MIREFCIKSFLSFEVRSWVVVWRIRRFKVNGSIAGNTDSAMILYWRNSDRNHLNLSVVSPLKLGGKIAHAYIIIWVFFSNHLRRVILSGIMLALWLREGWSSCIAHRLFGLALLELEDGGDATWNSRQPMGGATGFGVHVARVVVPAHSRVLLTVLLFHA